MSHLPAKGPVLTKSTYSNLRGLLTLLASLAICGCVAHEPLGMKPGDLGVFGPGAVHELSNSASESDSPRIGEKGVPRLIYVGRVMEFEPIRYEHIELLYKRQYLAYFETLQLGREPSLSLGQFANTIGGFTMIARRRANWIMGKYESFLYALVPNRLDDEIQYPNSFDVTFWSGVGDLVAAETNEDGVLIVKRILCRDGPDYGTCSSAYAGGAYDASTGKTVDYNLETLEDEPTIDTTNFEVIKSSAGD